MTQPATVIDHPTPGRYDVAAHLLRGYRLTLRAKRCRAVLHRRRDGRTKLVDFDHAREEAERLSGDFPDSIQRLP